MTFGLPQAQQWRSGHPKVAPDAQAVRISPAAQCPIDTYPEQLIPKGFSQLGSSRHSAIPSVASAGTRRTRTSSRGHTRACDARTHTCHRRSRSHSTHGGQRRHHTFTRMLAKNPASYTGADR